MTSKGSITVLPFDRHRWMVKADYYSQDLREVCYQVPGMRFDYSVKAYVGYPDAIEVALKLLREKKRRVDSSRFDPSLFLARNSPEPQIPVARKD